MASLIHQIWEEEENGQKLESCCLAGSDGDEFRKSLSSNARLLTTFEASCHFEAMNIYHRYLGREPYTTKFAEDSQPYPQEWLLRLGRYVFIFSNIVDNLDLIGG